MYSVRMNRTTTLRAFLAGVVATAMAVALALLLNANLAEKDLVQCQEDEVWVADHARGDETVDDLSCVHVDTIADEESRALVQCVPGEVWYPTSYADERVTPSELECIDPYNEPLP